MLGLLRKKLSKLGLRGLYGLSGGVTVVRVSLVMFWLVV